MFGSICVLRIFSLRNKNNMIIFLSYNVSYGTKLDVVNYSGFGMAVERVLVWILKLNSIKDVIGFSRAMNRLVP